jgi:hypothetical protein
MRSSSNAPKNIIWVICLILFLLATLSTFRIITIDRDITTWSWVLGYALLLVATKMRRL